MHWAARKRRLDAWKTCTIAAYRSITETTPQWPYHCTVEVTLPFSRAGRRDAHNYTSTVVKAMIDALVSEGMVADDTPKYIYVKDSILAVDKSNIVHVKLIFKELGK